MFKVSQSKVKTWRQCRQAYHFREVEGLRRKKPSRPLTFGTIVHEMLDSKINGNDPFKKLAAIAKTNAKEFRSAREEYGDIVQDVETIMREYWDHYKKDGLEYMRFENKRAEHSFEMTLTKGIMLKGKIDAFAELPTGLHALVEHKTFNRMPSEDHRWRNMQSAIYHHVAREFEIELDGTLWDYIRSKPPGVPPVLKDGSTSIKEVESLPTTIIDTLKERGHLKDKKYASLIKRAEADRKKWFVRQFNRVRPKVIDSLTADFIDTAKEMATLHGKSKTKTIDRHCEWCQFEPLCRAEIQGHDVAFTKRSEYRVEENPFDYHEKTED